MFVLHRSCFLVFDPYTVADPTPFEVNMLLMAASCTSFCISQFNIISCFHHLVALFGRGKSLEDVGRSSKN